MTVRRGSRDGGMGQVSELANQRRATSATVQLTNISSPSPEWLLCPSNLPHTISTRAGEKQRSSGATWRVFSVSAYYRDLTDPSSQAHNSRQRPREARSIVCTVSLGCDHDIRVLEIIQKMSQCVAHVPGFSKGRLWSPESPPSNGTLLFAYTSKQALAHTANSPVEAARTRGNPCSMQSSSLDRVYRGC